MNSGKRVIVIGAGLGGIAAAARLAGQGYRVTVLEKTATPGGRCNQLACGGHRFDTGATLFLMPEVFAETYQALGECMQDHLDLRRIDPTYRIHFEDGSQLALTGDMNALQEQLEALEPGSFSALLRYLVEGERHYRLSLERFVGRNFYGFFDYFNPLNLRLVLQMKALGKHYHNVSRYFHHPHLRSAFTFQNMYLGLSPYQAPATYSLLQYTELAGGVWFPLGGLYRVIESLVSIAEAKGVRFLYNSLVERIEVDGQGASGVLLQDGSYHPADLVLANADLPYVYQSLLPDRGPVKRLDGMQYTSSAILFYWCLDKTYPQLGVHNMFLADDYRASFDRIFDDHGLPERPSFYLHAPARVDPQAAPPGRDSLMALVPVGHLADRGDQDWPEMQARARSAVLEGLQKIGAGDLERHVVNEVCFTPQDWKSHFNLAKGAAFGLGHGLWQVGYLRPHNRHDRYRNLYFVGSSTHPGTGLPMALLSARLVTERIVGEAGID